MNKTREQKLEDLLKYMLEIGFKMRCRQIKFKEEYGYNNRAVMHKAEGDFDQALSQIGINEQTDWKRLEITFQDKSPHRNGGRLTLP